MKSEVIVAIDPGRKKLGLAVVKTSGQVLNHRWILTEKLEETLKEIVLVYSNLVLVLGNRTYASQIERNLRLWFPSLPIYRVEEAFSTQEARQLYWSYHTPITLKEHLLKWLRIPAGPWDDLAAIVLALRYLQGKS